MTELKSRALMKEDGPWLYSKPKRPPLLEKIFDSSRVPGNIRCKVQLCKISRPCSLRMDAPLVFIV
jgi:hypothetical protein